MRYQESECSSGGKIRRPKQSNWGWGLRSLSAVEWWLRNAAMLKSSEAKRQELVAGQLEGMWADEKRFVRSASDKGKA